MAKTNKNKGTTPPNFEGNVVLGGASEKSQLDWVLNSQNTLNDKVSDINATVAVVKAQQKDLKEILTRIESKLDAEATKVSKLDTMLKVGIAIVVTAGAVLTYIAEGKLGKMHNLMENNKAAIEAKSTEKKQN